MSEPTSPLVSSVRSALEESAFHAARGDRPPSRTLRGSPERIWDATTRLLLAESKGAYLSLDDPSYLVRAGVGDRDAAVEPVREVRDVLDVPATRRMMIGVRSGRRPCLRCTTTATPMRAPT